MDSDSDDEQQFGIMRKISLNLKERNYGQVLFLYCKYLTMFPEEIVELKDTFLTILFHWTSSLGEEVDWFAMGIYECAVEFYPNCPELLSNFAAYSLKHNSFISKARYYLERAHMLDSTYLPALKNLYALKERSFERWHFKMLNDKTRNEAYKIAIQTSIDEKHKRILDIGCGSGLLSLYAQQSHHAPAVTAVEVNETQVDIATKVFELNKAKIRLLNKMSTELDGQEIPRFNMLITEIFDTALFGEHALPALIHAWENLLEPDAIVIPSSADLYVTGINCRELCQNNILFENSCLNLDNVKFVSERNEPYDAQFIKDFNVTYLTNTNKIHVDFSNVVQLKQFYNGCIDICNYDILNSGVLHAFVIWFDLHLTDTITVTTNPFSKNSLTCWEQAVMHVKKPVNVRKDEKLCVKLFCELSKLTCHIESDITNFKDVLNSDMSNMHVSTNLDDVSMRSDWIKINNLSIALLNEKLFIKNVNQLCQVIHKHFDKNVVIMDYTDTPVFGFLMAKYEETISHCFCQEDGSFVRKYCEMNRIPPSRLIFYDAEEKNVFLQKQNFLDVIFLEPITSGGCVNEEHVGDLNVFKTYLKPNGIIIPEKVTLYVEAIGTSFVDDITRVDDKNLLGVKAAEIINKYSVPEIFEVDLKRWPIHSLSAPVATVNILRDDSIPCETTHEMEIATAGTVAGVLYWFDINYYGSINMRTIDSEHYKSAIFLFDTQIVVNRGNKVKFAVKQHKGLLTIYSNTVNVT